MSRISLPRPPRSAGSPRVAAVAVAAALTLAGFIYSGDENAGDQANLVQNAINQRVDGIALTLAKPDALKAVVAKAEKSGINVDTIAKFAAKGDR